MIIDGLTTLAGVKIEAGITDTTNDSTLEALINSCSSAVRVFLDRILKKTTYTSEPYAVNNSQMLYLYNYPITALPTVIQSGAPNTKFSMSSEDERIGRLYLGTGWTGNSFSRGTFPDSFAGERSILVTYSAGYFLPADLGYLAGDPASLPLAISYAVNRAVITRFRTMKTNAEGLASLGEGGLSYSWFGPQFTKQGNGGFDDVTAAMLIPYKRRDVA